MRQFCSSSRLPIKTVRPLLRRLASTGPQAASAAARHGQPAGVDDGRAGITASLVRRLVDSQFPQWSHLPVHPVSKDGWDNRTYRLGEHLTARLPTAASYETAVAKEGEWLPRLAPALLPLEVPTVQGSGVPGQSYPFAWSVRGWIPGDTLEEAASANRVEDWEEVAAALGRFVRALQSCDTKGGPAAGEHCWYRGCSLKHYDEETRRVLGKQPAGVDCSAATLVWQAALAEEWRREPVWFHGDLSAGNMLMQHGKLSAVIDFGTCGVGDPACDLVPAWTIFSGSSRRVFKDAVELDAATWARARGWALWKALITLGNESQSDEKRQAALALVRSVIGDYRETQLRLHPV